MEVYRHSLIFGLSYALDIAGKNNLSHSKSAAYISVTVGRNLGLDEKTVLSLYYAALLHDIGISNEYVLYDHCKIGSRMLSKLPLPKDIPDTVLYHHELFNGTGPLKLKGRDIPKGAQIICLSSAFDDMFGKHASESFNRDLFLKIQSWLEASGELFAPDIAAVFKELTGREAFLLDYFNNETKYALSEKVVISDDTVYEYEDILKFAQCFAEIIDRRSPFTSSHSRGIAERARKAAAGLGYSADVQDKMYLAGLLHDIGKLHISTDILHKNGRLSPEERFEINKHAYYTRKILEQINGFEEITDWAAKHHERMDGTGYPYQIPGKELGELEKIMAVCDIYQALTEERPYRTPLPVEEVWKIIEVMAEGGQLDVSLVKKLRELPQ